jgi:hypothetical protein
MKKMQNPIAKNKIKRLGHINSSTCEKGKIVFFTNATQPKNMS